MKIGNLEVVQKHQTVGPAHDPYGRDFTIVKNAAGNRAEWMCCGLVGNRLRLYVSDNVLVREEHYGCFEKNPQRFLKLRLLFKHHVGILPEEAESMYDEIEYSQEMQEARAAERAAGWDANP